jgi:hypothetical protein
MVYGLWFMVLSGRLKTVFEPRNTASTTNNKPKAVYGLRFMVYGLWFFQAG